MEELQRANIKHAAQPYSTLTTYMDYERSVGFFVEKLPCAVQLQGNFDHRFDGTPHPQ